VNKAYEFVTRYSIWITLALVIVVGVLFVGALPVLTQESVR
jgi:hypothetical protein